MGQIYASAQHTIIWLGEASGNSHLAMDFVSKISAKDFDSPQFMPNSEHWEALRALLSRPWWSRMWVIQEALLSPNATVRCGTDETAFQQFTELYQIYERHMRQDLVKFHSLSLSRFPASDIARLMKYAETSANKALISFRSYSCHAQGNASFRGTKFLHCWVWLRKRTDAPSKQIILCQTARFTSNSPHYLLNVMACSPCG